MTAYVELPRRNGSRVAPLSCIGPFLLAPLSNFLLDPRFKTKKTKSTRVLFFYNVHRRL
jgi:hypothetical protein